jgi:hypothetical protein
MRLAWFSPLPPARSGVAAYSAELVPLLKREFALDCFPESRAHDFVWQHRRRPYDLTVYQLGNAPFHDYMWPYLASHPGLVVLHDACLHHARARQLLSQKRFDDYRQELWFDRPEAPRDFVEYAIEGLGGSIYYFWSMLRVVMQTARLVSVHNARVAGDLRASFPETPVRSIVLGKAPVETTEAMRRNIRTRLALPDETVVFAVFGKATAEKRIRPIVRAFSSIVRDGIDARLLCVGDTAECPWLGAELRELALDDRVHVTGYIADEAIGEYLAAADVCLCLRWPTARETSAAWLHCLAAARATVITDLAHLADIPTVDLRNWPVHAPGADHVSFYQEPVAARVDLLDEDHALRSAMRTLATEVALRDTLARAGHAYWSAHHTMEATAANYLGLVSEAAARPAPVPGSLPRHFTDDYTEPTRQIAERFGVSGALSILR